MPDGGSSLSGRRTRGPATFRQRDLTAAIKAAKAAGGGIVEVTGTPIRVIVVGQTATTMPEPKNPWDEDDEG